MSNRTHSEESIKKISDSKIGKKHSDETKVKISKALKGENHPMYGQPRPEGALRFKKKKEVLLKK
jgi:hypothetical protein